LTGVVRKAVPSSVGLIVVDIDVPSPLSIGMGAINLAHTVGVVNAAPTVGAVYPHFIFKEHYRAHDLSIPHERV
ncbi:MAG TPA: hypothetical protein VII61_16660, partial [Ktedonobacteraceae bacterium]